MEIERYCESKKELEIERDGERQRQEEIREILLTQSIFLLHTFSHTIYSPTPLCLSTLADFPILPSCCSCPPLLLLSPHSPSSPFFPQLPHLTTFSPPHPLPSSFPLPPTFSSIPIPYQQPPPRLSTHPPPLPSTLSPTPLPCLLLFSSPFSYQYPSP